MEGGNSEPRKFSYTLCTRIIHDVVLENSRMHRFTTIEEVYDKFEGYFRWVDIMGNQKFPNDDYYTKCDKIYQESFREAVWRLEQILKERSKKRYLVVSDYPQTLIYNDDKDTGRYPTIFGGNKAVDTAMLPTVLECAFIIDDILSTGRHITNDEIYEELNRIFQMVETSSSDYKRECHGFYKDISKQAITRIRKELRKKGFDDEKILPKKRPSPYHKKKYIYGYEAEPGFSAFKTPEATEVNPSEFKFVSLVSDLYSKGELSITRLYEILERIDLIASSDTGSIEGDIKKSLHKIESLIKCKSDDYIVKCDKEFKVLFGKYKNHIAPIDYAGLLVLYADFIYESGLSKEFKDRIDLEDGWYNTIANSLETAVSTINSTDYTELYINYTLKYVRFVTMYNKTESYDKIELLYGDIFNHLQDNNSPLMAYALRSYAMLCYFRKNIDLSIETLEQAQKICRSKINDNTDNASANLDYLSEYIFATKELADISFDYIDGKRRDINRSLNEYKDVVKHYCCLAEDNPHLGFDFIHLVYYRLSVLSHELKDYEEEEKMLEKCALLSLSYAIKENEQKYIDRFEYDVINWAATLRKVFRSTLKESYKQALEQYMQLGVKLSLTAPNSRCVTPKSCFSDLKSEVEAFQRIHEYRANQNYVENKICLAEELEQIGDLHCAIIHSDSHEIIEEEYWEAYDIYQTINEDNSHTFTMLNLLGKLAKNFVSQNKMTDAGRMYGMLYDLVCKYIAEEEIEPLYEIDIAHLITDYASFLERNDEIDKSITIYEHALSFCDRISTHEQDTVELLLPDSSLLAIVLPSKAIKCEILKTIAKLYERTEQIEKAEAAYRKSIDFYLQEEKNNPGAYVVYIILQLEDFADMLKVHKSYNDADSMITHYLEVMDSAQECYNVLISKLPEFNWIKKAKQSVECTRKLVMSEDPLEWYPDLAKDLKELAEIQCIYKEYIGAKDSYLEIIYIYSEIEKDRPGLYSGELANAYSEIASIYKELGMKDEAIQSYDKANTVYKKLAVVDSSFNSNIFKCLKAQAELYESLAKT